MEATVTALIAGFFFGAMWRAFVSPIIADNALAVFDKRLDSQTSAIKTQSERLDTATAHRQALGERVDLIVDSLVERKILRIKQDKPELAEQTDEDDVLDATDLET